MTNFALMWAIFFFWIVKSSIWGKFEGVCVCEVCEFEVLKLYTFTMILNITHRQVNICVCLAAHSMLNVLPLRSFCCVDALRFYIFLCYLIKIKSNQSPQLHINEILY